jgi:hypothetical protein
MAGTTLNAASDLWTTQFATITPAASEKSRDPNMEKYMIRFISHIL